MIETTEKTKNDGLVTATIEKVAGDPRSGLWEIHFTDGTQTLIESGTGVRQLVRVFGSLSALKGQPIRYAEDGLGVMVGFVPVYDDEE